MLPSPGEPSRRNKALKPRQLHFSSQTSHASDAVAAAMLHADAEKDDIDGEDDSPAPAPVGLHHDNRDDRRESVAAIAAKVSDDDFSRFVEIVNARFSSDAQSGAHASTSQT
jgi:hypothetical protein